MFDSVGKGGSSVYEGMAASLTSKSLIAVGSMANWAVWSCVVVAYDEFESAARCILRTVREELTERQIWMELICL